MSYIYTNSNLYVIVEFLSNLDTNFTLLFTGTNTTPLALNANLSLALGLNFASLLFFLGLFGILWNQKNVMIIFLCVELMLFGAGLQFLFYYLFFNYNLGQIFALLILTVATAETAIGLGLIILAYRLNRSISFEAFTILRG
jgi:NADH-quinone oxidoreductase subunit K